MQRSGLSIEDLPPQQFPVATTYQARSGKLFDLDNHIEHDWKPRRIIHQFPDGRKRVLNVVGIEVDMDTEGGHSEDPTRQSIYRKFISVLSCLEHGTYEQALNIRSAIIFFYFNSFARMENMQRLLHNITNGEGSEHIGFFRFPNFKDFEDYPPADDFALRLPYERVGSPPLNILETLGYQETTSARENRET